MTKHILYVGLNPTYDEIAPSIVTHCPLIQIVPRPIQDLSIKKTLEIFNHYTHLIITSKSTIPILIQYLSLLGYKIQDWSSKTIVSVGKATAKQLNFYGIEASIIANEETSEGIISELNKQRLNDAFLLWPHSAQSRTIIRDFLEKNQLKWEECILYDTQPLIPQTLPNLNEFDEIVFTSPSTIDAFLTIFGHIPFNKKLTPIGPITADYLKTFMTSFT